MVPAYSTARRVEILDYLTAMFPFGFSRSATQRAEAEAKVQVNAFDRENKILVPNKSSLTDYYKEFVFQLLRLPARDDSRDAVQTMAIYPGTALAQVAVSHDSSSSLLRFVDITSKTLHPILYKSWTNLINNNSYEILLNDLVDRTGMGLVGECRLLSYLGEDRFKTYQEVTQRENETRGQTLYGFTLEELQRMFTLLKETSNLRMIQQGLNQLGAYVVGASDRYSSIGCTEGAASAIIDRSEPLSSAANSKYISLPDDQRRCRRSLNLDFRNSSSDRSDDLPVFPMWNRYGSHLMITADIDQTFEKKRDMINEALINKDEYAQLINFMVTGTPVSDQPHRQQTQERCMVRRQAPQLGFYGMQVAPTTTITTELIAPASVEIVEDVVEVKSQKKKRRDSATKQKGGSRSSVNQAHETRRRSKVSESSFIVRQLEERSKGSKSSVAKPKPKAKVVSIKSEIPSSKSLLKSEKESANRFL